MSRQRSGDDPPTKPIDIARPFPINPPELGTPRGYANGMMAASGGRLLFIAGQIAWDREQKIVSDDFAEQFERALDNVLAVVRTARGVPEHLAQLTIYVVDKQAYLGALEAIGIAYRTRMGDHYPAMALVEVQGLLDPQAKVEIQGIAVIP